MLLFFSTVHFFLPCFFSLSRLGVVVNFFFFFFPREAEVVFLLSSPPYLNLSADSGNFFFEVFSFSSKLRRATHLL